MSIRQYWPITENDVYVKVFNEILDEIDHSLFDEGLISNYSSLGPESRYLITRMYLRTPKWIRVDDLAKYMAPEALKSTALPDLIKHGWVSTSPPLSGLLSDVSTLSELQDLGKSLGLKVTNLSRKKLVDQLIQLEKQQSFFNSGKVATKISDSLKIECYFLKESRRRFLFQLEQNFLYPVGPDATLEVIFLTHMKKQAFYPYSYLKHKERPLFADAETFQAYASARETYVPIFNAVNSNNKVLQLQCVSETNLSKLESDLSAAEAHEHKQAAYTLGRSVFDVSQIFMKLHQFNEEYIWLQKYLNQHSHSSKRGLSLIRKLLLEIRFLSESQTKGESSWLVSAVNTFYDATNEVNEIELLDLNRKTTKLLASIRNTGLRSALSFVKVPNDQKSASMKIPIFEIIAVPTKSEKSSSGPGTRVVYENGLNVEQLALEEYSRVECGDFRGGHFEGSIITTIFWLLSFDLLFKDPEQFRCAYQSSPINLQQAIDASKDEIHGRLLNAELHVTENRKKLLALGEPLPYVGGINWLIPIDDIIDIIRGLGNRIIPILQRLMSKYYKYNSGFPDLTLWNAEQGRTKFVEVKSENDTVSDNQQLWMEYMLEHGIEVEICKVIPAKRATKRKRN